MSTHKVSYFPTDPVITNWIKDVSDYNYIGDLVGMARVAIVEKFKNEFKGQISFRVQGWDTRNINRVDIEFADEQDAVLFKIKYS